jgi:CubicO group peptidase (beta-lactamase class C family)
MRKMVAVLIFLLTMLICAPAQAGLLAGEMAREAEALTGQGGAKGAILAVVEDGKVAFAGGFGWADEAMNVAASDKTAFRIGSISKTFVAVAAQLMAQQGQIDMDEDVAAYLEPDFPAFARPVTMRMLLTHSAGFEDMTTGIAVPNVSDTLPLSVSVRRYRPAQSIAPGIASYSNYGIALAAYAVERASGQDFAQFCREEIFLPLDMTHTTFEHMHDVAYVAKPYLPDGRETAEPFINLYPEGSAVSAAGDMVRYLLWLADPADERVLNAESKAELFARQFAMADGLPGMGYVWNRKARNGLTYYDKKGETLNFESRIAIFPEKKAGVFLSVNTFLPPERLDGAMRAAADTALGEPQYGQGQATFDIAGVYADNNAGLSTMEKVIRYLVPGKMLSVEGSMEKGYSIGGQALAPVGEDEYASPLGVLKFLQKDGQVLIATQSATSYARVPAWQARGAQAAVPVSFLLLTLLALACALAAPLRGRAKGDALLIACLALDAGLFVALCAVMLQGITAYRLLDFAAPVRALGWAVAAFALLGAFRAWTSRGALRYAAGLWALSSLLLIAQMAWLHILA